MARQMAVERGWGSVRMGALARKVGVSRQTLHSQFGTKAALGEQLVLAEADQYLAGVVLALDEHRGNLTAGLEAAVTYTLTATRENPLVEQILTGTPSGRGDTLLPALTIHGGELLRRAAAVVGAWIAENAPEVDGLLIAEVSDSVVRLVLSHVILPIEPPSAVGERLSRLSVLALQAQPA